MVSSISESDWKKEQMARRFRSACMASLARTLLAQALTVSGLFAVQGPSFPQVPRRHGRVGNFFHQVAIQMGVEGDELRHAMPVVHLRRGRNNLVAEYLEPHVPFPVGVILLEIATFQIETSAFQQAASEQEAVAVEVRVRD